MLGTVIVLIASVWALLVGAAFVGRGAGLSRIALIALVTSIYAALAAGAFIALGATMQECLGAFGMLLPFAVALFLGCMPLPRERS